MSRKMPIFCLVCILTVVLTAALSFGQTANQYAIVTNGSQVIGQLMGDGGSVTMSGISSSDLTMSISPLIPVATAAYSGPLPGPPGPPIHPPIINAIFANNGVLSANVSFSPNPSAPGTYNGIQATTDPPTVTFTTSTSPKMLPVTIRRAVQDPTTGNWKMSFPFTPGDYYYSISAHNGWGTTSFGGFHCQIVNLAGSPTGVTTTGAIGGFGASWQWVPGAAGFSVQAAPIIGGQVGPYTVIQQIVNGTSVSGLVFPAPNTQYNVTVSALNGAGVGPPSTPVQVLSPPAVPTNVVALPPAPNYMAVMWSPSAGAASYSLNLGGVTVTATAAAANCPTGVGMCTYGASGFPSGTQTSCSVAATNSSGGQSAYSGAIYCATQ